MTGRGLVSVAPLALPAMLLVAAVLGAAAAAPMDDEVPAGFQRILPRGRIPSMDDPKYVPASQARIPADSWVLGVVMEGQAKAYDLNLLTRHEVVNDRMGQKPIAAVW